MKMKNRLLIDGDIWCYKYAAVAQYKKYTVMVPEIGYCQTFNSAFEANKLIKDMKKAGLCSERTDKTYPLSETVCHNLINREVLRLQGIFGVEDVEIFISSPNKEDNPRYRIAKTVGYKSCRKNVQKPIHFESARKHLMSKGAVTVFGMEPDDRIGIKMYSGEGIGCSDDKDFRGVPGRLYIPRMDKVLVIKDPGTLQLIKKKKSSSLFGTGFFWFCAQMLMGDSADSIPGVKGIGDVGTYKLLHKCKEELEAWDVVCGVYKKKGIDGRLKEIAQLLWIRRVEWMDVPHLKGEALI